MLRQLSVVEQRYLAVREVHDGAKISVRRFVSQPVGIVVGRLAIRRGRRRPACESKVCGVPCQPRDAHRRIEGEGFVYRSSQIRVSHSRPSVPASELNWSPYFSDASCIASWESHSLMVVTMV